MRHEPRRKCAPSRRRGRNDIRLNHHRCIRQFILAAAMPWKMRRQLAGYFLDTPEDAGLEIAGPELGFHRLADSLPTSGTDLRIDAAIGNDLDIAIGEQQINQHAVVVGGVPDPQMREDIERALPGGLTAKQRRTIQRAFDDETDLTGMGCLARLDRPLDSRQRRRWKNPPYPPAVLDKMLADASDTHVFTSSLYSSFYQLPDAPPPPKLPPPPLNPPLNPPLEPLLPE